MRVRLVPPLTAPALAAALMAGVAAPALAAAPATAVAPAEVPLAQLAPAQAAPGSTADPAAAVQAAARQVAALRADVARSAARLTAGTRQLERGRTRLARLRADAARAQAEADAARAAADRARARLGEVVSAEYRNPGPGPLAVALAAEPAQVHEAVRAVAEIDHVRGSSQVLLAQAEAERVRADRLAGRARTLQQQAAAVARGLEVQVAGLRRQAQDDGVRLGAAARRLERAEAARRAALARERAARARAAQARAAQDRAAQDRAAQQRPVRAFNATSATGQAAGTGGGATCQATSTAGYANGFLPASALCALRNAPGHRLRKDAAEAFDRMAAAGAPCLTDSYRDYAGQVAVYAAKPGLAAVPGTSNHGLGVAIDVGCGAASFGSPAYRWLKANAPRFGWTHPAWAEPGGSRPEPWHWEYVG